MTDPKATVVTTLFVIDGTVCATWLVPHTFLTRVTVATRLNNGVLWRSDTTAWNV